MTPLKKEYTMGQGFYTALGFGCVDAPTMREDQYEKLHGLVTANRQSVLGRCCYEAEEQWWGFLIAENGAGISDDDNCDLMSYSCLDAQQLLHEVFTRWPARVEKCQAAWERFREAAAKVGVNFPEGRLILVNDYD
jgi:hypothetical protein